MAQKRRGRLEPEIIFGKILFTLGGAILGAIVTLTLFGRLLWGLELSLPAQIAVVLLGALVGAVEGWLWANRDVWSD
ncbi:MAG: hypothetical protein RMK89_05400 [Armatimonadota bacterium]|nr:hypothetical protein [Armatimonadota bacterium]MDW8142882.1 hypothetical protein [Armatimonadota bacterium]